MTFVVTENCINCKHTTCVEVCPTDAFREGENFLVIDPDACVDCDLCPAECPVDAIYSEDELPKSQIQFLELNAKLSKLWSEIDFRKDPLSDHEFWDGKPEKIDLLIL